MAATHQSYTDMVVIIDDATGSTARITSDVTSVGISGDQNNIDDLAFGTTEVGKKPAAARCTFTLAGLLNSTTEAIFGPLIGNRTSVLKTLSLYDGIMYETGEAYPSNVQKSADVEGMGVWSASFDFDGAVTRTSVAPS